MKLRQCWRSDRDTPFQNGIVLWKSGATIRVALFGWNVIEVFNSMNEKKTFDLLMNSSGLRGAFRAGLDPLA